MKRLALLTTAIVLVVLLAPNRAYAVCQKCESDNTRYAKCVTLSMCDSGATMSTCYETETFDQYGFVTSKHCESGGTTQGPECNGADPSCTQNGGGGTGGSGGTWDKGFTVICVVEMFAPCDFSICDICYAECTIMC